MFSPSLEGSSQTSCLVPMFLVDKSQEEGHECYGFPRTSVNGTCRVKGS